MTYDKVFKNTELPNKENEEKTKIADLVNLIFLIYKFW